MNVTVARIYGWLTLFNVLLVGVPDRVSFCGLEIPQFFKKKKKKSIFQRVEEIEKFWRLIFGNGIDDDQRERERERLKRLEWIVLGTSLN